MSETENKSPRELVAILHAAHVSGDRDLERAAKRELRERFGIELTYRRATARGGVER